MRFLLVLLVLLGLVPAHAQDDLLPADLGSRVTEAYVQPTVDGFVSASSALVESLDVLCATPTTDALVTTRTRFAETIAAWGRLSVLRFGPLVSENRFETIFFWPDTRGVTLRQVQEALATADPSVTDPEQLSGKSVALQNLLALDFLLAGTGAEALAEDGADHRCAYAQALGTGLGNQAVAIADGWLPEAPIGGSFRRPGGEGYFRSETEVAGEIVKALVTAVDFIAAAELGPAMGETLDAARGRRAPLWRSDLTFVLIEAQLSGLIDLLAATGFSDTLTGARASPLNNLVSDLTQAARTIATIGEPIEAAFTDPDTRRKLDYVALLLGYSSTTIGGDLTAALGLTMGFNALDGD